MNLQPLKKADMPKAPPIGRLIGPSFILLGMGLGSGELILWPYLSSNFGLGIIWASILGITFQFFINMEIARYTLVTGESIFVGLTRKFGKFTPIWFIFSTLVPWMWPGIIAASATATAKLAGIDYSGIIGIIMLIAIGVILSLGSVIYKTQVRVQKAIILIGIPFIFAITLYFAHSHHWLDLLKGLVGKGDNYWFIPAGLPLAPFLAAFAYAGAGGNLNLAQSLYVKEKGYGMSKFSGKLTNIFKGVKENVSLEGATFEATSENLKRFKTWWRRINAEHALVFLITGAFTMLLLALLAYVTVFGNSGNDKSIMFVINEAGAIAAKTVPILGSIFLALVALMLFGTQFSVIGSNSRIMGENLVITNSNKFPTRNLSKYFYVFLWAQIFAGVAVFLLGFTEPLALVVLGAVLNAFSMFIYTILIYKLNTTVLQVPLRPSLFRKVAVLTASAFYGVFTIFTILQQLKVI